MTLFHLILVAALQGVTEFLPISSSGHLILLPGLTGLDDQGLAIDVAVHVGTLAAVVLYFRRDVAGALAGVPGFRHSSGQKTTATTPSAVAVRGTGVSPVRRSVWPLPLR